MRLLAFTFGLSVCLAAHAVGVVINEVSYHPPGERDDLQFVELHNAGGSAVDLSGWKFTAGLQFAFPPGSKLAAGGFLVVAKDPLAFAKQYKGMAASGPFAGVLKHGGERVALSDAAGLVVDAVKYTDRAPWPVSPDGSGATLERVSAAARGDDPGNWAPSTLPERETPAGTPGKANSRVQLDVPPTVSDWSAGPWRAGAMVPVTARVEDVTGIGSVTVQWVLLDARLGAGREQSTVAQRVGGTEFSGRYEANLPAVPAGRFLRFWFLAKSRSGALRTFPDPQELRPTLTLAAWTNAAAATIPQFFLMQSGGAPEAGNIRFNPWGRRGDPLPDPTRGGGVLLVGPTNGGPMEVHDYVRIRPRSGGWKVNLSSGDLWNGVRSFNVIYESKSRSLLSEHLGYELFRRAGVPAPDSGHVRLTLDGQPLGYHLWIEQPNRSFLQRHRRDPRGELFKAVWYGESVTDRHEKKTQIKTGYRDFLETVRHLETLQGDAQWKYIEEHFDVDETANYYAVNLLIQNWDGYFNNHYLHHAPAAGQKWQIYPWDLDKTWGDFDGASARYDWYSMPITFGMKGDREPSNPDGPRMNSPWGVSGWWRPGGVISAPLLANPQYRARMLKRLRELLDTQFTAEQFGPVIRDLEAKLLPEVRHRLELRGNDVAAGERRFKAYFDSFRAQIKHRAEYLRAAQK